MEDCWLCATVSAFLSQGESADRQAFEGRSSRLCLAWCMAADSPELPKSLMIATVLGCFGPSANSLI
ncbi:hypothetical protein WJX72_003376 [[Myrmecia] bisecta]|uniref:Uncharacterized protein n=1 Tax=[Myrmecia] bisecta TaxID=41462 RepID=A0AAW1QQ37_9CHLO